jgi:GDPmannose 4,6-dehydratase
VLIWLSYCWRRAVRFTVSNAARVSSIRLGWITSTKLHVPGGRFFLYYGDLTDATNLIRIVQETQPDEICNLAAQCHVQASIETPKYTANSDALGALRLLEAIRILKMEDRCRFYQASTSKLYGNAPESQQKEKMPFVPVRPYVAAKLYAHWTTHKYRDA